MITVKVPGKLMLMGEHAVVYGRPCLVAAVNKYLTIKISLSGTGSDIFVTPGTDDNSFLSLAIKTFRKHYGIKEPVWVETKSELGEYGLGSSAAVTVATVKALAEMFQKKIDNKELFNLAYQIISKVQGLGSGFDTAAVVYGGILYFVTAGKTIEPLPLTDLNLVVGYSGVKADTVEMLKMVEEKKRQYPAAVEKIFNNIADLVEKGKKAIVEKDWPRLGTLMNYNQDYLEDLGVSTPKLNDLVIAARSAGAYGAKLSGAGGGDCMIALVDQTMKEKVKKAIQDGGGKIIEI
jgi:mevalonate kinase